MASKTKTLIAVIQIREDLLKQDNTQLSLLTDLLDQQVLSAAPQSLDLEMVYLIPGDHREDVVGFLDEHSLPFHEYAVEREGSCQRGDCDIHVKGNAVVIQLHDRRPNPQTPPDPT